MAEERNRKRAFIVATLTCAATVVWGYAIVSQMNAAKAKRAAVERNLLTGRMEMVGKALYLHFTTANFFPRTATLGVDGKPLLSWRVSLLPYLGEQALFDQFRQNEPWDSPHNAALIANMPSVYADPGSQAAPSGTTRFLAARGRNLVFDDGIHQSVDRIAAGINRTIMLVEAPPERAVIWTKPDDLAYDENDPWAGLRGGRDGGFVALFADGSVHAIPPSTPKDVLNALFLTRGDKKIVPDGL